LIRFSYILVHYNIKSIQQSLYWPVRCRLNPVVPWGERATTVGDTLVHHTVPTCGRSRTLLLGNGRPSWIWVLRNHCKLYIWETIMYRCSLYLEHRCILHCSDDKKVNIISTHVYKWKTQMNTRLCAMARYFLCTDSHKYNLLPSLYYVTCVITLSQTGRVLSFLFIKSNCHLWIIYLIHLINIDSVPL